LVGKIAQYTAEKPADPIELRMASGSSPSKIARAVFPAYSSSAAFTPVTVRRKDRQSLCPLGMELCRMNS
jgi:hypothetical protein